MKPIFRVWLLIVVGLAAIASPRPAGAAPAGGLEGRWTGEQANSDRTDATEATLIFTQGRGALTGIMRVGAEEMPLFDVKENGTNLSFTLVIPGRPMCRFITPVRAPETKSAWSVPRRAMASSP